MHRIAIVDDESIFREYLRTAIDWSSYGFEVGFEARNGIEALELLEETRVDIALVDINMPFMDGLELVKNIKVKYPDMPVVLITGHSEFEYARKAVKLGAFDYILKPFEKEELILTMLKIKGSLQKVLEENIAVRNSMEILRDRVLNSLIDNHETVSEDIKTQLEKFGISSLSQIFRVSCIEIDNMDQNWDNPEDKNLWKFALKNVLNEVVEVSGNHINFDGPEGRIISMIEFKDKNESDTFSIENYVRLCNLIKRFLGFTITVGVGNVYDGYCSIRDSYNEATVALQNKFILGSGKVIEYAKLSMEHTGAGFYATEIHEDILINLRLGNWAKLEQILSDVFKSIKDKRLSIDYTYAIYMGLISICLSYVVEVGSKIEDLFGRKFLPIDTN